MARSTDLGISHVIAHGWHEAGVPKHGHGEGPFVWPKDLAFLTQRELATETRVRSQIALQELMAGGT
jgi:hypothetical protein